MKKLVFGLLTFAALPFFGFAQETASGINPNSVYPIHESDIMYQKRVWRRVNLNEKQNRPFMAVNKQLTKFIYDAVEAGLLQPYANDSLTTVMSKETWKETLVAEAGGGEDIPLEGASSDSGWGDPAPSEDMPASSGGFSYGPKDTYVIEIQEDLIFDKKRSRMYWDILSFKLILPAEKNEGAGIEKDIAVFKYKDLEKLFRNMPNEAVWFNPQNSRAHLNFADAFNLRLFSSRIVKVANPDDNSVFDLYPETKKNVVASEWVENQLMEFEHELWEF